MKKQIKAWQSQQYLFPKMSPRNKNSKLFIGIYLNRKKYAEENNPFMLKMGSFKDVSVSKFNWLFYSMNKRLNSWFRANQN